MVSICPKGVQWVKSGLYTDLSTSSTPTLAKKSSWSVLHFLFPVNGILNAVAHKDILNKCVLSVIREDLHGRDRQVSTYVK